MRGGLLIENPAGGLARGDFKVNLTTVRPELALDTLKPSMLFADCASAWPMPIASRTAANAAITRHERLSAAVGAMRLICVAPVVGLLRRAESSSIARSSHRLRLGP